VSDDKTRKEVYNMNEEKEEMEASMKEILFCSTVNREKAKFILKGLEKSGISYLQRWEEISVFKRKKYNNAKEICSIYINPGQISEAEIFFNSLSEDEKKEIIRNENK